MYNRAQLKKDAKLSMRGRAPSVYLVTLVYLIVSFAISIIFTMIALPKFNLDVISDYIMNNDYEGYTNYISGVSMSFYSHLGLVATVLALALVIVNFIFNCGYSVFYCLRVSRGESAGYGHLLDGFGLFLKLIWLDILISVFTFLWSLLFYIPGVIAQFRYSQAMYIMAEHPEYGALRCIRESKQMMKGNKWKLFVMELSFIGWLLLSSILPILSIYTQPYISVSFANFYNYVSGCPTTPRIEESQE